MLASSAAAAADATGGRAPAMAAIEGELVTLAPEELVVDRWDVGDCGNGALPVSAGQASLQVVRTTECAPMSHVHMRAANDPEKLAAGDEISAVLSIGPVPSAVEQVTAPITNVNSVSMTEAAASVDTVEDTVILEVDSGAAVLQDVDRHGFLLSSRDVNGQKQLVWPTRRELALTRRREQKWVVMLRDWDNYVVTHVVKAKRRVRKGIPDALRGRVWQTMTGSVKKRELGRFEGLQAEADALMPGDKEYAFLDIIERDLDRTFPHHDMFADPTGQGQRDLRSILRAYVVYNKPLGYCQGMGMLVGTLLMHVRIHSLKNPVL